MPAEQRAPRIAAASNLNFALPEIAKQFERDRGGRVELVFGSSGMLARQVRDGAPFEMFLAADEEFPNQLSAEGLTRDAGVVYAIEIATGLGLAIPMNTVNALIDDAGFEAVPACGEE